MIDKSLDKTVSCELSSFRYLSNINGLSVLDGTYLELLIIFSLKSKKYICLEGLLDLEEVKLAFNLKSISSVKSIMERLHFLKALGLYKKTGKYHKHTYAFSINQDYAKYFFIK